MQLRFLLSIRFKLKESVEGKSVRFTFTISFPDRSKSCRFCLSGSKTFFTSVQLRPQLVNFRVDSLESFTGNSSEGNSSLEQLLELSMEYKNFVRFLFWTSRASGRTLDPSHVSFSHRISSTEKTLSKRPSGIGPNRFPEKSIFRSLEAPRVEFSGVF